jgi:TonB-dependent starch-binding outer membrane protein SusC
MRSKLLLITGLLLLAILPAHLFAQNKEVSGRITDANGLPFAGASIIIKQTNKGTTSDSLGRFSLSAPSNSSLVISAAGYKSQTIAVTEASGNLQIQLFEDIAKLEEVVVTGISTGIKRQNLANAVATISNKELNGTAPAQTFDAALSGKIPGAYINANSGAPGGGITVKLRGVTSFYGNTQPLYVVDGVYWDNSAVSGGLNAVTSAAAGGNVSNQDNPSNRIADLRAEDIDNIEILKGASAAATTKRGKSGKTRINFSQTVGVINVRRLLGVRQFTAETAASLSNDSATSVALSKQFLDAQAAGKLHDYEKEVYGNTGFARNSVLSISGGGDKTTFYFSAATKKEDGIVDRTGYKNTSLRLNIDHKINENIKIGLSTNYINSSSDRGLTGNDNAGVTYSISLSSTPNFAQLHPDQFGNFPKNPFAASNVLQTVALMTNNENTNRFSTGANIDALLFKTPRSVTRFVGRGGVDFYNLITTALFPSELQFQNVNKGTSIQGFTKNLDINYMLSLVNNFEVSDDLGFTTSAGYTQETGDFNNLLNIATQMTPGQSGIDQGGALTAQQFRYKFQNDGLFIQEEANIKDAIILTAGVRFDRSTNNGDDTRKFNPYGKGSISVNLTRLGLIDDHFFNNLKVRAAYGQSANFPIFQSRFTSLGASNIDGLGGSLVNIQGGDPNIKPERQTELEAGLDFSVLNSKLNFEFTVYNKKIYDFLLLATVPPSSGFSTKYINAGDLRNHGLELGVNAQPISTKKVRWNTSVNFWLNRSKVLNLTIPPVVLGSFGTTLGTFYIEQGKSATQIVGTDDNPQTPDAKKGALYVLGDAEPTFQLSSFNEVTFFNRLSLRFLLHWKQRGDNINLTNLLNDFGGTSVDFDADNNHNGKPDGVDRITQFTGGSARGFVQDAGYFRVREIGLYYTFGRIPGNVIQGLHVGVSLYNYITITNYQGYDPEVSNFGTGFSTGVDVDPYPASKRASFNVSIDF